MSKQGTEAPDQPMPEKAFKELFGQSHDRGRAGLPVMSLSIGRGLVPRNQDERRVETNLSDEQHRLVRAGELAYNMMRMWQGVCGLAEEDCLISPAYVVVRPLNGMDPKFSEYLLTYEETVAQFKLLSFGVVDDRLRLYFKDFERVRVRIPSPQAQRKIARILTTLDNLIHKTEALITKYQAIKQGMMHGLFTRGVDAHGHLRPPQSEAPDLYRQSVLSWIPKCWEERPLGSVCTWMSGGTPSKSNPSFWSGTIPWVSPKDMKRFEIGDSEDHISEEGARIGTRMVPAGTVLIVIRGMILAHSFPVCLTTAPVTFNQDIKALTNNGKVCGRYLAYWLVAHASQMIALATESTHGTKRFDIEDLQGVQLGLPSVDEQQRVVSRLDALAFTQEAEHEQLNKLTKIKSGLMQDLLTGKVRVKVDELEEVADA